MLRCHTVYTSTSQPLTLLCCRFCSEFDYGIDAPELSPGVLRSEQAIYQLQRLHKPTHIEKQEGLTDTRPAFGWMILMNVPWKSLLP